MENKVTSIADWVRAFWHPRESGVGRLDPVLIVDDSPAIIYAGREFVLASEFRENGGSDVGSGWISNTQAQVSVNDPRSIPSGSHYRELVASVLRQNGYQDVIVVKGGLDQASEELSSNDIGGLIMGTGIRAHAGHSIARPEDAPGYFRQLMENSERLYNMARVHGVRKIVLMVPNTEIAIPSGGLPGWFDAKNPNYAILSKPNGPEAVYSVVEQVFRAPLSKVG